MFSFSKNPGALKPGMTQGLVQPTMTQTNPQFQPQVQVQPQIQEVRSKARIDKFLKLSNSWKSALVKSPEYLEKLLKSEDFGRFLSEPMSKVFPLRSSSSAQEILKNKKVVPELQGRQFEEIFNSISSTLNICIGSVYEILEEKLLNLAKKQSLNWVLTPSNHIYLERIVVRKWHEDRLVFLGMKSKVLNLLDNTSDPNKLRIVQDWITNNCQKNQLLSGLVDDLEILVELKAGNFSEKERLVRVLTKIKEQNFIFMCLYQLIRNGFKDTESEKKLLQLGMKTEFVGVFSEKINEGVGEMLTTELENSQNNAKIMFDSLILETLMQGGDLDNVMSPEKIKEFAGKLIKFDQTLIECIKENSKSRMDEE